MTSKQRSRSFIWYQSISHIRPGWWCDDNRPARDLGYR